jgi:glutathione S-transferase
MEPLLIYGFPLGSSAGLITAFEWLAQPYRLSRVDMLHDMKTDAYGRLNARRETPVLITDRGHVLTESMAIALWLEARDCDRKISPTPASTDSDRMHQFMAFVNSSFTPAFSPLWAALELSPPDPNVQSTLRAFGRKSVLKRHEQLEAMLGDSHFLIGDRPTLADAMLSGVARWLEFHQVTDVANYPKLQRLRRRLESDAAFVFARAIEAGETPTGTGAMRGQVPLAEVLTRSETPSSAAV